MNIRDVGGGNMFLTLVSKTDQSGSVLFKSGDYAGYIKAVEVYCHAPESMTEQFQPCK
jgi:hypothetical protein